MKYLILIFLLSNSFSAIAFHSVTEVLPSGKILICKDENQIRKENTVETYQTKKSRGQVLEAKEKVGQLQLPSEGDKISVIRQNVFRRNKVQFDFINKKMGEANILDYKLEGEAIEWHAFKQKSGIIERTSIINLADAQKIKDDCIVAKSVGEWRAEIGDLIEY